MKRDFPPLLGVLLLSALCTTSPAHTVKGQIQILSDARSTPRIALFLDGVQKAQTTSTNASLYQEWTSFWPKLQVAQPNAQLNLVNRDQESHTVHALLNGRTLFNLAMVPGGAERQIQLPETGVVTVGCDLHSYMNATIIVESAPYAIVKNDGSFAFHDIPSGDYEVRLWRSNRASTENSWIHAGKIQIPDARLLTVQVDDRSAAVNYAPPAPATNSAQPKRESWLPNWLTRIVSLEARWPQTMTWVLAWTAIAILLGHVIAIGNLNMAKRRHWSRMTSISIGCGLSFFAGAMVIFGLHGAVASALGFGIFVGTIIFGFVDFPS